MCCWGRGVAPTLPLVPGKVLLLLLFLQYVLHPRAGLIPSLSMLSCCRPPASSLWAPRGGMETHGVSSRSWGNRDASGTQDMLCSAAALSLPAVRVLLVPAGPEHLPLPSSPFVGLAGWHRTLGSRAPGPVRGPKALFISPWHVATVFLVRG